MATPNVPTNVRLGRVKMYTAATGATDPIVTVMPTGGYTYVGWMAAATTLLNTSAALDINVDDLIVPVDVVLNSRAAGFDGSLAEFYASNANLVIGGTLTSQGASGGVSGYDLNTLKSSDDIVRKTIVIEQIDPRELAAVNSLPVGRLRVFFPYCTIQPNGNIELSRKREAGLPFSVRAHPSLDGAETLSKMYLVTA